MFCAMRHAHAVQRLGDKRFALARSHSSIRQRQLDILKDGEIPYQIEALKNEDRKSTRLNSSHSQISYAVFCLKKKKERTMLGRPVIRAYIILFPFATILLAHTILDFIPALRSRLSLLPRGHVLAGARHTVYHT